MRVIWTELSERFERKFPSANETAVSEPCGRANTSNPARRGPSRALEWGVAWANAVRYELIVCERRLASRNKPSLGVQMGD